MWFFFGFITLISFSIYFGIQRHKSNWKGTTSSTNGITFKFKNIVHKKKYHHLHIGCSAVDGINFSIKIERWWDKLFKWLGISVEHQVGISDFDKEFYLITDDHELCSIFSQSIQIQEILEKIAAACDKHNLKIRRLHFKHGTIWLHLIPVYKDDRPHIDMIARDLIPKLKKISDIFKQKLLAHPQKKNDPFILRAIFILAISTGLAINGLTHIFRIMVIEVPFIIDDKPLFNQSFPYAVAIIGILIIITFILLGRTARTHLVLIELFFIGSFGAVSSSYLMFRDANIDLDTGSPEYFEVKIYEKKRSRGRRHTSYYLKVDDWYGGERRRRIEVSRDIFYRFNKGDDAKIEQMAGYFGHRWVADIKTI